MKLEERIKALESRVNDMDEALERVANEHLAFKLAFIRLSAYLPVTESDVTMAREMAIAQAEDAMTPGEIPHDTARALLESIHAVCAVAGYLYRQRMGGQES